MLVKLIRKVIREIQVRRDPVGYARSLGVRIGDGCHIYNANIGMWGADAYLITVGDNVHLTEGVMFITHDGGTLILRKDVPDLEITAPITIGNDVYIGVNSIILPGVNIGNRCVIGAGSVVTKDIPENSVAVGVPARVIKSTDEYLEGLKKRSLHLGHLKGNEKAKALRAHFGLPSA
jgi:acetyltransferase-like isoleucine patch superfamily enzyme